VHLWLDSAWGKFRCWQRVCAQPQRLTPDQLRAAWLVWDAMKKSAAAHLGEDDDATERLHQETVALVGGMPVELRKGPSVFSHWLVENREKLSRPPVERTVAEKAHTTDHVSVELTQ
jgi:hypothetical protein